MRAAHTFAGVCAANELAAARPPGKCMPPLWYLLSLPDPAPPCTEFTAAAASYYSSSSSSRVLASSIAMDAIRQQFKVSLMEMETPADLIIRIGDSTFPLHKAVMAPKCGYIRRAITALSAASAADNNGNPKSSTVIELDLSALPGGAAAFENAARYCYGANFEITPSNAASLRCAAAFLDMRHPPSTDLSRRVDEFLTRSALRTLPGALAVLRSCESPDDDLLRVAADELGLPRRAADGVALAVCRESLFPTGGSPGWWKPELAALSPRAFGKVVTALRCRRADTAVVAAAAGSYAELVLAEVLAAPRDCEEQRALLESVVDVLPSSADAPGIPAAFLCRLLHAAVATEASAKACRDLELRVAAVLDQVNADDLLGVALDGTGERVRNADTVRRVVTAFVERHAAAAAESVGVSDRRSRRASMSGTTTTAARDLGAAGARSTRPGAMEKVAKMVDEVAAEMATEEALPISKFVGLAGAIPKDARGSHDCLYRAVDIYLKTHPALDEIQREKVCSVMDPLKLSYQARLHASQNKRLPLQAVLSALYYDQLKLRSTDAAAATLSGDVVSSSGARQSSAAAAADAALARENEALRMELARMRAYMSGIQQDGSKGKSGPTTDTAAAVPPSPARTGKKGGFLGSELARMRAYMSGIGSTPVSPCRTAVMRKVSFLGSVSRSLSRLNPFRGGWTTNHAGSITPGGRKCKTMQHHLVVTPKRRRSSIS